MNKMIICSMFMFFCISLQAMDRKLIREAFREKPSLTTFQTDRLILMPLVLAGYSDDKLSDLITQSSMTTSEAKTFLDTLQKKIAQNMAGCWVAAFKKDSSNCPIGLFLYQMIPNAENTAQIQAFVTRDKQKKGIATEAFNTLIYYAYHCLKLNALQVVIDPDNKVLQNICAKFDFKKVVEVGGDATKVRMVLTRDQFSLQLKKAAL